MGKLASAGCLQLPKLLQSFGAVRRLALPRFVPAYCGTGAALVRPGLVNAVRTFVSVVHCVPAVATRGVSVGASRGLLTVVFVKRDVFQAIMLPRAHCYGGKRECL